MERLERFQMLWNNYNSSPVAKRILQELGFLLALSSVQDKRFDDTILPQVEYLYENIKREGAITQIAATQVERKLALLADEAKKYKVRYFLCPSIQPQAPSLPEVLKEVQYAIMMLERYPHVVYFEPRTAVYRLLDQIKSPLLPIVQQYVTQKRWEIGVTSWAGYAPELQTAQTMLDQLTENRLFTAELFARPVHLVQVYFALEHYMPHVELLKSLFYHDISYGYIQGTVRQNMQVELADHSEILLLKQKPMQKVEEVPVFAQMLQGLFTELNTNACLYPVILESHAIEDTMALLDQWEELGTLPFMADITSTPLEHYFKIVPQSSLEPISYLQKNRWFSNIGFLHAHDITDIGTTRREALAFDAMAQYAISEYPALFGSTDFVPFLQLVQDAALNSMALELNTNETNYGSAKNTGFESVEFVPTQRDYAHHRAEGMGAHLPHVITLFNATGVVLNKAIRLVLPTWCTAPELLYVMDYKRNLVDFQVECFHPHKGVTIAFMAEIPAFGYQTYMLEARQETLLPHIPKAYAPVYTGGGEWLVLENNFIKAVFSAQDMTLHSMYHKLENKELLLAKMPSALFCIQWQEDLPLPLPNTAPARSEVLNATCMIHVKAVFFGAVQCWIEYEIPFEDNKLTVRVSLDQQETMLRWNITLERPLAFRQQKRALVFDISFAQYATNCIYKNQWGIVQNVSAQEALLGVEALAPFVTWEQETPTLLAKNHHSVLWSQQNMKVVLLARDMQLLETQHFEVGFGSMSAEPFLFCEHVTQFLAMPVVRQNSVHKGKLPAGGQFFAVKGKTILLHVWQKRQDFHFYLQIYNPTYQRQNCTLSSVRPISHAILVDVLYQSYEILHQPLKHEVSFQIPANDFVIVKILLAT